MRWGEYHREKAKLIGGKKCEYGVWGEEEEEEAPSAVAVVFAAAAAAAAVAEQDWVRPSR